MCMKKKPTIETPRYKKNDKRTKKFKTIEYSPLHIGVTRKTKKRVWLDTKVTIKYDDGSSTIDTFDTYKEALEFASEIIDKDRS